MDAQWIAVMIAGGMFMLAILGIAFQVGRHAGKIDRNEKDIATLNVDFKKEMTDSLRLLHDKIDKLPCHNPGWKKDSCG